METPPFHPIPNKGDKQHYGIANAENPEIHLIIGRAKQIGQIENEIGAIGVEDFDPFHGFMQGKSFVILWIWPCNALPESEKTRS
jgi:hypothetical protein